jgi:hypothetical protein
LAAELRATRPDLKALFVSGVSEQEFAGMGGRHVSIRLRCQTLQLPPNRDDTAAITERQPGQCLKSESGLLAHCAGWLIRNMVVVIALTMAGNRQDARSLPTANIRA